MVRLEFDVLDRQGVGQVAASTQNQARSAWPLVYRKVLPADFGRLDQVVRAWKPKRLPVVFTPEEAVAVLEETVAVLNELRGTRWLMGLLYGGGLRLKECLRLRVKDLDFERLQTIVRDAKGEQDRVTLLPKAIVNSGSTSRRPATRFAFVRHPPAGGRHRYPHRAGIARNRVWSCGNCCLCFSILIRSLSTRRPRQSSRSPPFRVSAGPASRRPCHPAWLLKVS